MCKSNRSVHFLAIVSIFKDRVKQTHRIDTELQAAQAKKKKKVHV